MPPFSFSLNSRMKSEVLKLKIGSAQEGAYGHMGLAQFREDKE